MAVEDARALRWVPVTGPLRLKTEVVPEGEGAFTVTLHAWRDAENPALSRYEPVVTGRVRLAPEYGTAVVDTSSVMIPVATSRELGGVGVARRGGLRRRNEVSTTSECQPSSSGTRSDRMPNESVSTGSSELPSARGRMLESEEVRSDRTPQPEQDPYETGALFHGPSFQLLRSLTLSPGASSSLLDAAGGGPPRGLLHEALLDALTHGIPHDRLWTWSVEVAADQVAYPHRIVSLRLFAPLPATGEVRCETRFVGFDGGPRFPRFHVSAFAVGRLLATLDLVEALFPKGVIGAAPPRERRAFLRDRRYIPGLRLSHEEGGTTRLADAEVSGSDWLPGTLALAYEASDDLPAAIAVKEHVAARAAVHPASVSFEPDETAAGGEPSPAATRRVLARCAAEPLTVRALTLERRPGAVVVADVAPPVIDLSPVRGWWDGYFKIGRWPVEDVYFGLAERFVSRVRLEDPAGFAALRGRGVLYLSNHQVGIESILFSLIATALSGTLTVTLAKIEHRATWLGNLIRHAFAWPGAHDPGVITYFDRSNREELPRIIGVLAREIAGGGKSVMIHVEGTRALTCRAPVQKMSGAFLDMAVATGAAVVPVRFTGGLPVAPAAEKLEYPVGMGAQEIIVGAAITPAELAGLTYKERKERAIDAINALGPAPALEQPHAPDPAFAAAVRGWAEQTGASFEHAALFETLRRLHAPGDDIARLIAGARAGVLELPADARGRWLGELARRLFGPRGPEVTTAGAKQP